MNKNPYEILQVAPHAETEVIEAAYRRLARKYHPDTCTLPDALERMQDLNWAYDILGNPNKRARYDSTSSANKRTGQRTSSTYSRPASDPSYTRPKPKASHTKPKPPPSHSKPKPQSSYKKPQEDPRINPKVYVGLTLVVALLVGLLGSMLAIIDDVNSVPKAPSRTNQPSHPTVEPTQLIEATRDYVLIPTKGPWQLPDWAPEGAINWFNAQDNVGTDIWTCGPITSHWRNKSEDGEIFWIVVLGQTVYGRYSSVTVKHWVDYSPIANYQHYFEPLCVFGTPYYPAPEFESVTSILTIDVYSMTALRYIEK